jgi:hypothetical protein
MSGRLIRIAVDGATTETRVKGSSAPGLELLQGLVGGYIELVKVQYLDKIRNGYVDEDGLSKNLPPNQAASSITVNHHRIVGPLVIWVPDGKGET